MARIAILCPFEYEKKHEQNLFELIHDKKS